jgi:hypothetical protein
MRAEWRRRRADNNVDELLRAEGCARFLAEIFVT